MGATPTSSAPRRSGSACPDCGTKSTTVVVCPRVDGTQARKALANTEQASKAASVQPAQGVQTARETGAENQQVVPPLTKRARRARGLAGASDLPQGSHAVTERACRHAQRSLCAGQRHRPETGVISEAISLDVGAIRSVDSDRQTECPLVQTWNTFKTRSRSSRHFLTSSRSVFS